MIHSTQWALQPLRLLFPFVPGTRMLYEKGIEYTKAAFGTLLGEGFVTLGAC